MTGNDIVDVAFGVVDLIQCGVIFWLIKRLPGPSETTRNPQVEEASIAKQATQYPTLDRHLSAAEQDLIKNFRLLSGE